MGVPNQNEILRMLAAVEGSTRGILDPDGGYYEWAESALEVEEYEALHEASGASRALRWVLGFIGADQLDEAIIKPLMATVAANGQAGPGTPPAGPPAAADREVVSVAVPQLNNGTPTLVMFAVPFAATREHAERYGRGMTFDEAAAVALGPPLVVTELDFDPATNEGA